MQSLMKWAFLFCFFPIVLFSTPALSVEEGTAQLTFSKTAVSPKNTHAYTVLKGDVLSAIVRRLPGITEKDIPRYYALISDLNPGIADFDRLYTGQIIILPGSGTVDSEPSTDISNRSDFPQTEDASVSRPYTVKKGDSLIRIVHRELNIQSKTQGALLIIKELNPSIKDANKIYAGQKIRLPAGPISALPAKKTISPKESSGSEISSDTQRIPSENSAKIVFSQPATPIEETKTSEAKESLVLSPAARLSVIKHIISQMNGNLMTIGNYYLPVSKTEQLTVDCSIIPVLELDDGTTLFLDLENRSNHHLKKMINDHWSNFHLVKIDDKDDIIVILKKIFQNSKSYDITKAQKTLTVGSLPPMEISVDWIIASKSPHKASKMIQGLRFVYDDSPLLPRAVVNTARQHSAIITEISPTQGLVAKTEEIYSMPSMIKLPTASAGDFALALLEYLKIPSEKNINILVFNIEKDGFNLSIKADIAVSRDEKKFLIFSRHLPPQFVSILHKAGNELIFISDSDKPDVNMEKILRGFHFIFTSGYFSFSGLDKNQPPYAFGFKGTKIKADSDTYVVNFDFNQELRGLLQESWSANVVQY